MIIERITKNGCQRESWRFTWELSNDAWGWTCRWYRLETKNNKRNKYWNIVQTTDKYDFVGGKSASPTNGLIELPPIPPDVAEELRKCAHEAPIR